MVDIFYKEVCSYCKNINDNCDKILDIYEQKEITTYKCKSYLRDDSKIKGYEKPLIVTAERDYINSQEF